MKLKSFGVSVYPDIESLEDITKYLERASKFGCEYVFSSMFSVEGTKEEVLDYFKEFIKVAHSFNIKVVLDLNPPFLKKMGVDYDDVSLMHDIGCDVMRMDMPFGAEKDLVLVNNPYNISIMFNASGSFADELAYFEEHGVPKEKVLLGHNFYPQPYTGLKWKNFLETNRILKQYGYPVQAFISSRNPEATGVWDANYGLPTVERLRNLPIDTQARIIEATGDVDMVWIGNAFATEEEMESLIEVQKDVRPIEDSPVYEMFKSFGLLRRERKDDRKIRVVLDEGITDTEQYQLFEMFPQLDMGDSSEWIWRSRTGRMVQPDVPFRKCEKDMFEVGDVLIVNNNYQHYAGEIQIVRIPFKNDGQRNYLGHLAEGEELMLDLLKNFDEVTFLKAK